jgi:hypothetical protein
MGRQSPKFSYFELDSSCISRYNILIPEPTRGAPYGRKPGAMVLIPPRLFTPGKTKALAKSEVHQWSRAWVTNGVGVLSGWSSSLISKIWRTVMNSDHWLVKFKICIITTVWRQRNSNHFLIWWFLANIYFIFARFCEFQKLFKKKGRKNRQKERSKGADVNEGKFVLNINVLFAL